MHDLEKLEESLYGMGLAVSYDVPLNGGLGCALVPSRGPLSVVEYAWCDFAKLYRETYSYVDKFRRVDRNPDVRKPRNASTEPVLIVYYRGFGDYSRRSTRAQTVLLRWVGRLLDEGFVYEAVPMTPDEIELAGEHRSKYHHRIVRRTR